MRPTACSPATLAALTGLLLVSCGGERRYTTSSAASAVAGVHAPRALQRIFGDYDNDDYGAAAGDSDSDDRTGPHDGDGDFDSHSRDGRFDGDDASVIAFGPRADTHDRRAVTALVSFYFELAARGDSARGCALIDAPYARTFASDLAQGGPTYLRGAAGCASVLSRLFAYNRARFGAYAASLNVTDVRVHGDHALAVISFGSLPLRQIEAVRERGAWKLYAVVDRELP
jgi:hypothetical protein